MVASTVMILGAPEETLEKAAWLFSMPVADSSRFCSSGLESAGSFPSDSSTDLDAVSMAENLAWME
jgi:hypothetical protein